MAHILIVDDESGIRESLQGVLEDEGYKITTSPSGEDCLELMRKSVLRRVVARRLAAGNRRLWTRSRKSAAWKIRPRSS